MPTLAKKNSNNSNYYPTFSQHYPLFPKNTIKAFLGKEKLIEMQTKISVWSTAKPAIKVIDGWFPLQRIFGCFTSQHKIINKPPTTLAPDNFIQASSLFCTRPCTLR